MSAELSIALAGIGAAQWSGAAHLPAIEATAGVRLTHLVTSNEESARRASHTWGVPASADLEAVLRDPEIVAVSVTVRVARHFEIVSAAMRAGKHVYCEWPLGIDTTQASDLQRLSIKYLEQVHVVGLQGRLSPELQEAARMVSDGRIGRTLRADVQVFLPQGLQPAPSTRHICVTNLLPQNVLSIQGGHVLDMLVAVLVEAGPVRGATIWTAIDEFVVLETGDRLPRDAPDNVLAHLRLGEVPVTLRLSQTSTRSETVIDILGSTASLRLTAPDQPQMSAVELTVTDLDGKPEVAVIRALNSSGLGRTHPGRNVGLLYSEFAHAISSGTVPAALPTFERALLVHRAIDSIEAAAARPPGSAESEPKRG
jgi:predicted dehydrogenase